MTDDEKKAARKARRREHYRSNCLTIRAQARQRYADQKKQAETAKKLERRTQFSIPDRDLLQALDSWTSALSGKYAATADHILRTAGLGMPYKGWQDDAREALSLSA